MAPSTPPPNLKILLAHRRALAGLTRLLTGQHAGGVLGSGIETLVDALRASGAIAYRAQGDELVLVAEQGLSRKAKPWLVHLKVDDEPWFVAQRVAKTGRYEVDTDVAGARGGHSLKPTLLEAGWKVVAATPIAVARQMLGVLVLAASNSATFSRDTKVLLETAGGILALALARERELQREREQRLREKKTAQLATIGLLTSTAACDLAAPLEALTMQMEEQERTL